jgi:hypothetical protein
LVSLELPVLFVEKIEFEPKRNLRVARKLLSPNTCFARDVQAGIELHIIAILISTALASELVNFCRRSLRGILTQ